MGLAKWKEKFVNTKKSVMSSVAGAVDTVHEKASKALDTTLTLESAQKKLANDLEKGLRIFDEIGLPEGEADDLQEEIATYVMDKLVENFPKKEDPEE